jgi:acyl-CoA thioester hydrolase
MTELLKEYPAKIVIPVQWGDMDSAQHVNNTVYLRWMESARIELFNRFLDFAGFSAGSGVGPILAEISCQYKLPVTFPDTVTVCAKILSDSLNPFGFSIHSIVVSHQHQRIAAQGVARIVCYNYATLSKAPIPAQLLAKIGAL